MSCTVSVMSCVHGMIRTDSNEREDEDGREPSPVETICIVNTGNEVYIAMKSILKANVG